MKKTIKSSIGMAIFNIIEKILGLLKTLLVTFFYGASVISDVFNIIYAVPDTIQAFIGNGVIASYIPIASGLNREENNYFTSNLIAVLSSISLLICTAFTLYPQLIIFIFAPGFSLEAKQLSETLVKISIWSFGLTIIKNILISFLQLNRIFVGPNATNLFIGVCQCLAIILSFYYSNIFLAFGILIGTLLQTVVLTIMSIRNGFRLKCNKEQLKNVKRVLFLAFPVVLSTSASRLNVIVDKAIASFFTAGAISLLSYADVLVLFLRSVFAVPVNTVLFPKISKLVVDKENNDYGKIEDLVNKCLIYLSLVLIPITFGTIALAEPIIKILYGRGSFTQDAVYLTSQCLQLYVLRLYFTCSRDLFVNIHYAFKDTKSATINVVVGFLINIVLNFVFSKIFGITGLALATSVASIITLILLIWSANKFIKINLLTDSMKILIKVTIASAIMLMLIIVIQRVFPFNNSLLEVAVCIIAGVVVYAFAVLTLRIIKLSEIKQLIKKG